MLTSDFRLSRTSFKKKGNFPRHSHNTLEICCGTKESGSDYLLFSLEYLDGESSDEQENKKKKRKEKKRKRTATKVKVEIKSGSLRRKKF